MDGYTAVNLHTGDKCTVQVCDKRIHSTNQHSFAVGLFAAVPHSAQHGTHLTRQAVAGFGL